MRTVRMSSVGSIGSAGSRPHAGSVGSVASNTMRITLAVLSGPWAWGEVRRIRAISGILCLLLLLLLLLRGGADFFGQARHG